MIGKVIRRALMLLGLATICYTVGVATVTYDLGFWSWPRLIMLVCMGFVSAVIIDDVSDND